jgi:release factor glutamine methyltransferase
MFDCVLSNPPYIAKLDIETLEPQIRDWEPRLALDGGEDGLDCYRQIASQCGALLKPSGFLAVELGAGQFAAVQSIFEEESWMVAPPVLDLAGIERVLLATLEE